MKLKDNLPYIRRKPDLVNMSEELKFIKSPADVKYLFQKTSSIQEKPKKRVLKVRYTSVLLSRSTVLWPVSKCSEASAEDVMKRPSGSLKWRPDGPLVKMTEEQLLFP